MANIAMVLGPDFEDSEYRIPHDRLVTAGHRVTVIGSHPGESVTGKRGAEQVQIDAGPTQHDPQEFQALVIPGGYSPDKLRLDEQVVSFVRRFVLTGRPVAAVCHGPQLLIEAEAVKGRRLTSWPSVKKDLQNAGAHWVDQEVVVDGPLITSRKPADLEAFSQALLKAL